MKKNEKIVVRAVSNGFIVTPKDIIVLDDESSLNTSVFQTMGELEKFLRAHFSFRGTRPLIIDNLAEG